jgi:hypothetical protein
MSGKDGCPMYQYEVQTCDLCGNVIVGTVFLEHDDNMNWHRLCQSCINASPCQTCVHQYCAFQQDSHCPEPPYVMREVRQGNMIAQTQVMNPKRVEATCRQGCPCFNEDGLDAGAFCGRQSEWGCNKYHTNWRN